MDTDTTNDFWNNILVGETSFLERRQAAVQLLNSRTAASDDNKENASAPRNDPTLDSCEQMRLLGPSAAAASDCHREPAPADETMNREDLMRLVEQRMAAWNVGGKTAPSTTHNAQQQPLAAKQMRTNTLPKAKTAAAKPTTATSKTPSATGTMRVGRSANVSPKRTVRTASAAPGDRMRPVSATSPRPGCSADSSPAPKSRQHFVPTVPTAYNYKAIYEEKRKRKLQLLLEEERKAREVIVRPMPNFGLAHRQIEAKRSEALRAVTMPKTPKTLRQSQESAARRRQRIEQHMRDKCTVQQVKPREADVLEQPPFRPQIEPRFIEPQPFKLIGHERGEELSKLRERRAEEYERKRQQTQQEREERDRLERLEYRKQTVFKARPNPIG